MKFCDKFVEKNRLKYCTLQLQQSNQLLINNSTNSCDVSTIVFGKTKDST